MAVNILEGGSDNQYRACLYSTVTDWAFGPVFDSAELAEAFLDWLERTDGRNPRVLTDKEMEQKYYDFRVYLQEKEEREAAGQEAAYFDSE